MVSSMYFINPRINFVLRGESDLEILDLEKSFEITKDLDEDPNTADLIIYNMDPDLRKQVSALAGQYTPVEIYFTAIGKSEFLPAFRGEIETVDHRSARPGYETRIHCEAQKRFHRAKYLENQVYAKGTPKNQIVDDIVEVIGLPTEYPAGLIPTTGILLALALSGPAYPVLQGLCRDSGLFCYILDGVLRISEIENPPPGGIIKITDDMLLDTPQTTSRTVSVDTLTTAVAEGIDPGRAQYRKARQKKEIGKNDYEMIDAIDIVVPGMIFELFGLPTIQPDMVVEYQGNQYRIHTLYHFGDDAGNPPTTRLMTDAVAEEEPF
jgi:hypothetical protein